MPTVQLRIDPRFCGPASVGTVEVIRLLCTHLGLSLVDAKAYVDRCVFEGDVVSIHTKSIAAAHAFASAATELPPPAAFYVTVNPAYRTLQRTTAGFLTGWRSLRRAPSRGSLRSRAGVLRRAAFAAFGATLRL